MNDEIKKVQNEYAQDIKSEKGIVDIEGFEEETEDTEDVFGFPKELLDTPIDSLDLTKRAKNCLKREKIDTIRDLLKKRPEDLLKIKNFGKKSMEEVRKELKEKFDIDYDKLYEDERGNDFDEA